MRYKSKVLAQHPDARLVVIDRWDDGSPRYTRVVAGPEGNEIILDTCDQGDVVYASRAWRVAYYHLVRERNRRAAVQAMVAAG